MTSVTVRNPFAIELDNAENFAIEERITGHAVFNYHLNYEETNCRRLGI